MSKRTILYLALGSIVLIILGVIFLVLAGAGVTTDADGTIAPSATTGIFALIGIACYGIGGILALIAWIGALIKTATIGAWGWFVLVLLVIGLGTLIYGIAGPETRATPVDYRPVPSAQPTTVAPTMTFKRAACGVLWTLYTLALVTFNVFLLTKGQINIVTVILAALAFLCGWYAYRIWTFQARRLVFLIFF